MLRVIKVYGSYFARFFLARVSYRGDFFASLFSTAVASASGILFVFFLMDGQTITALRDWSRDEVFFIYGYSQMSTALFSLLSPNLYGFGDRYVIQGQFDRVLLRPLSSLAQVVFESFEFEALGSFCVGLSLMLYAKSRLSIQFGTLDILWIGLSTISGAAILMSVFVMLASCSFHFEDRMGITAPVYNMIPFSRYPLPIFNKVLQFILQWLIPFAFVGFYPATRFFSKEGFELFCYATPFAAVISALVAWRVWEFGVGRYSSTGN